MSAAAVLANMSRGWNRDPVGVALGTDRTGISAALWTHDRDDPLEIAGQTPPVHALSVQFTKVAHAEIRNEGRATISRALQVGACNLTRQGERTSAVIRGSLRVLQIFLPDELVRDVFEAGRLGSEYRCVELIDPGCAREPLIERIGREMLAEMQEKQHLSRLRVDALGHDLAIQLLRRWSNLAGTRALDRALEHGKLAPWQVKRAVDFLMSRLEDDVSMEELAASVRLSPFHFARSFKRSTGLPPQRYLMERRVERARELLAGTNMALAEIALACGFAGQSHFTTAFKRHTGLTPGAWRAAVRH